MTRETAPFLRRITVLRAFFAGRLRPMPSSAFHVFEFLHADPGFGVGRFEVGKAASTSSSCSPVSSWYLHDRARMKSPARFHPKARARIGAAILGRNALAVLVASCAPRLLPRADLSFAAIVKSFAFIPAPDLSRHAPAVSSSVDAEFRDDCSTRFFALTLFLRPATARAA